MVFSNLLKVVDVKRMPCKEFEMSSAWATSMAQARDESLDMQAIAGMGQRCFGGRIIKQVFWGVRGEEEEETKNDYIISALDDQEGREHRERSLGAG